VVTRRVWHQFLGVGELRPSEAVLDALLRAGVVTYALDLDLPRGPGVLFFTAVTDQLCSYLREVSHGGRERVLAVALTPAALAGDRPWRLLRSGASDVVAWRQAGDSADEVAARFERWDRIDRLVESPLVRDNLVGQSPAWTHALRQIAEVASCTQASVLIVGETGTGKELVARLIHSLDTRPRRRDLVVLDCTTVARELAGSEFFGHEKGAFTGAVAPRDGAFALADGGTLFLDEVGDLSPPLQAELLRVVQEHTYKRLGSNTWHKTDFRLVCATNKPLLDEVMRGEFRRDFYYRIAAVTCELPPLRERPDDILPLARHFMEQLRPADGAPEIDASVCAYLMQRSYPGNVRDLRQLVERIMYRHVGPGAITPGDIPEEERPSHVHEAADWRDAGFEDAIRRAVARGVGLKEISRVAAETAVRIAVGDESTLQGAARKLGVTDRALQMRRKAGRQRRHVPRTGDPPSGVDEASAP
jgi:transcriptional regulator with GAF, ATPase, and Fis domain